MGADQAAQSLTDDADILELTDRLTGWAEDLVRAAGLSGICLGGSLIHENRTLDRNSDVDLFGYCDGALPSATQVADWLGPAVQSTRARAFLTEARLRLLGYDTNIKFFTLAQARRFVLSPATLDEHYLEEAGSFDRFRPLAVAGDGLVQILDEVRARRAENIGYLARMAFERYAKSLSWAASQWQLRDEPPSASMVNLSQAYNALLQLYYLQHDVWPVTTKWRGSERYLAQLPGGGTVFRTVNDWLAEPEAWQPACALTALLRLEQLISQEYRCWPWSSTAADLWWHPGGAVRGRPAGPAVGWADQQVRTS